MPIEQFLNIIACVALILFGVYALLRPVEAAEMAHLKIVDATGRAETRITLGGLFLLLGIAPLVLNEPAAFQVAGMALLGAFVTRLLTLVVDHPVIETIFIASGTFELLVGLVLVLR